VSDARRSIELSVLDGANEVVELADGADYLDLRAVVNCEACRVVASVLEPPKALEQDGSSGTFPDVSDDAAHVTSGHSERGEGNTQRFGVLVAQGRERPGF
jgi:hypothetical protein